MQFLKVLISILILFSYVELKQAVAGKEGGGFTPDPVHKHRQGEPMKARPNQ